MTQLMQMRDTGEEALLGLGPCSHHPMWGAVVPLNSASHSLGVLENRVTTFKIMTKGHMQLP